MEYPKQMDVARSWIKERFFLELTVSDYVKGMATPFNIVAGIIVIVGLSLIVQRYASGLGAVTAASQD